MIYKKYCIFMKYFPVFSRLVIRDVIAMCVNISSFFDTKNCSPLLSLSASG